MNYVQWVWEFESLKRRELQDHKNKMELVESVFMAASKTFRETLISLLGLNIGTGGKPETFVPLVYSSGRAETVSELMKLDEAGLSTDIAVQNEQFDTLNDRLRGMDFGDLEPVFSGALSPDPHERWNSPENQQMLRDLGIELFDSKDPLISGD